MFVFLKDEHMGMLSSNVRRQGPKSAVGICCVKLWVKTVTLTAEYHFITRKSEHNKMAQKLFIPEKKVVFLHISAIKPQNADFDPLSYPNI